MSDEEMLEMVAERVDGDAVTKPWDGMVRVEDLETLLDIMEETADITETHSVVTADTALGVRIAVAIIRDDLQRGEI